MIKVKFLPYVADIVFRARCVGCVSVVNIELNFGSDADFVRFPVLAAALTPISLLEPSFVFILGNFFKSLLTSHSWCLFFGRSVRDRFILVIGSSK